MGKYWRAYGKGQPRGYMSIQFSKNLPDFVSGAALGFDRGGKRWRWASVDI